MKTHQCSEPVYTLCKTLYNPWVDLQLYRVGWLMLQITLRDNFQILDLPYLQNPNHPHPVVSATLPN